MVFFRKKRVANDNKQSSRPIFIGGDGRSGTTLLSVVLDVHSKLVVGPELHFNGAKNLGPYALECANLLANEDPRAFGKGLKENPDYKLGVQFVKRCHRFGVGFDELAALIERTIKRTGSDLKSFEERCELIHEIGELRRHDTGKERWGIKIMREIKRPDRYLKVWPKAQFIHIIRDGRDVAASQLIEHGKWGYEDIKKAASGWVEIIESFRKYGSPENCLEIRYEDLVLDAEKAIRKMTEFLGVEFEPDMLRHNEVEHTLFDNPYNHASINQVVKPLNDSSIERFRNDLTPEQIEKFWDIAGSQLAELGYKL